MTWSKKSYIVCSFVPDDEAFMYMLHPINNFMFSLKPVMSENVGKYTTMTKINFCVISIVHVSLFFIPNDFWWKIDSTATSYHVACWKSVDLWLSGLRLQEWSMTFYMNLPQWNMNVVYYYTGLRTSGFEITTVLYEFLA